jgi:2-C-methyl-D-erythritol 4-phosphate cytidylyltransferase
MNAAPRVVAIVPAAGLGIRLSARSGGAPKQFLELDGVPILLWTLRRLAACPRVGGFVVAVRSADRDTVSAWLAREDYGGRVTLVEGGESRHESVARALAAVGPETELVLVHDAVRPFVEAALLERVLDAAAETGAAILGLPATDTLKQVEPATGSHGSRVLATVPRERMVLAQTPQVFRAAVLREAFARAAEDGFRGSDEAVLVERLGRAITVIKGSERNLKITTPDSLELARALLAQERVPARKD